MMAVPPFSVIWAKSVLERQMNKADHATRTTDDIDARSLLTTLEPGLKPK